MQGSSRLIPRSGQNFIVYERTNASRKNVGFNFPPVIAIYNKTHGPDREQNADDCTVFPLPGRVAAWKGEGIENLKRVAR